MILRKTKEYKLNLGNYESATVSATIEIDTDRDNWTGTTEELNAYLTDRIDSWVARDVKSLGRINAPLKDGQSAIDFWEELHSGT